MKKVILNVIVVTIVFLYSCGPTQTKEKDEDDTQSAAAENETEIKQSVFFLSPSDNDTVTSTFNVVMGIEGMEVEPSGEVKEGYGHHHILINLLMWPEGEIIPPSDTTIHYGKGQTETELTMEPGEYTISLQFADGVHRSYGESMAASIKVVVQ